MTGRLDETTMTDDAVTAPDVLDLARRVRVVHDPELDAGYPAGRPARVRVTLRDGGERSAAADRPRGDADRAFSRAELRRSRPVARAPLRRRRSRRPRGRPRARWGRSGARRRRGVAAGGGHRPVIVTRRGRRAAVGAPGRARPGGRGARRRLGQRRCSPPPPPSDRYGPPRPVTTRAGAPGTPACSSTSSSGGRCTSPTSTPVSTSASTARGSNASRWPMCTPAYSSGCTGPASIAAAGRRPARRPAWAGRGRPSTAGRRGRRRGAALDRGQAAGVDRRPAAQPVRDRALAQLRAAAAVGPALALPGDDPSGREERTGRTRCPGVPRSGRSSIRPRTWRCPLSASGPAVPSGRVTATVRVAGRGHPGPLPLRRPGGAPGREHGPAGPAVDPRRADRAGPDHTAGGHHWRLVPPPEVSA